MARNDGIDRTSVRNLAVSDKAVGNTQQHNEREKDSYRNPDIIPQRTAWNIHFKKPTASYTDLFAQLEAAETISTRGLKPDATHYCELVFDVNSAYFDNHGGYEFAKQFYEDAYKAAFQIVGGEQYILSAVTIISMWSMCLWWKSRSSGRNAARTRHWSAQSRRPSCRSAEARSGLPSPCWTMLESLSCKRAASQS